MLFSLGHTHHATKYFQSQQQPEQVSDALMHHLQAQHSANIHAKQAQQARAELEEVRRAAADSVRASTVSTDQLRELQQLRSRSLAANSPTNGDEVPSLQGRLAELSAELESLRLGKAEAGGFASLPCPLLLQNKSSPESLLHKMGASYPGSLQSQAYFDLLPRGFL